MCERVGLPWPYVSHYPNGSAMVEPDRRPTALEIEELIDLVQRDPASPAFIDLGEAYLALGRPRDSIGVGLLGLEAAPDSLEGRVMLARAHASLHQWKEAQAELLRVVKIDRSNRRGFALLGEVLLRRNDFERAVPVLQHAQNLDPTSPQILALLKRARAGQPLDPPPPLPQPVPPRGETDNDESIQRSSRTKLRTNEPTIPARSKSAAMAVAAAPKAAPKSGPVPAQAPPKSGPVAARPRRGPGRSPHKPHRSRARRRPRRGPRRRRRRPRCRSRPISRCAGTPRCRPVRRRSTTGAIPGRTAIRRRWGRLRSRTSRRRPRARRRSRRRLARWRTPRRRPVRRPARTSSTICSPPVASPPRPTRCPTTSSPTSGGAGRCARRSSSCS